MKSWAKFFCSVCWLTTFLLLAGSVQAATHASIPTSAADGTKTLYERIGGETSIRAVVDDFLARATANPRVDFFRSGKFGKAESGKLRRHLIDFIGSATGGPQKYTGRDMTSVHSGMKISEEEFNALVEDLSMSLDTNKVSGKEKAEVLQIASSTKAAIIVK